MAPSTPPPPSSDWFAALTMASSLSVVMSATQTSSRAAPTSAVISGFASAMAAARLSRPFGLRLGAQIDRAAHPDIVEVVVEEAPRGALAVDPQHLEVIVVGRHLADGVEGGADRLEDDAMHIDAPVFPGPGAARQAALIDQAGDEVDGAVFADQRGVEGDLVDAVHDLGAPPSAVRAP